MSAPEAAWPCRMFMQEPYPFAWCETHDETFPLGQTCPYDAARRTAGEEDR